MVVHDPIKIPFDAVRHAGIAITESYPDVWHVGMLYKVDGGSPRICHLKGHFDFKDESPPEGYFWLQAAYKNEITLRNIAAFCAVVGPINVDQIPFGYRYNEARQHFELKSGKFLGQGIQDGLTCATFVLAIFATLNIPFIRLTEWTTDPMDALWQMQLQEAMARHLKLPPSSPEVAEWAKQAGAVRFRPQDVAAAAAISSKPVGHAAAVELGEKIIRDVKRSLERRAAN